VSAFDKNVIPSMKNNVRGMTTETEETNKKEILLLTEPDSGLNIKGGQKSKPATTISSSPQGWKLKGLMSKQL